MMRKKLIKKSNSTSHDKVWAEISSQNRKTFKNNVFVKKVNNKKGGGDQKGSGQGRETSFFFNKSYSETKGIFGAFAPIRVLEN